MNRENVWLEDIDDVVRSLQEDVHKTRSHLRVYSGEATRELYSGPVLEELFFEACDRGVKINFIVGPILSVGESRSSLILRLAKDGKINLYFRSKRGREPHYRIIDNCSMYLEGPHEPVKDLAFRHGKRIEDPQEIEKWIKHFDTLIKNEGGEGFVVRRVSNPEQDLLLLTDEEIKLLSQFALRKGQDISLLERQDIQNLYQEWLDERERLQKEAEPEIALIMKSLKEKLESLKQVKI